MWMFGKRPFFFIIIVMASSAKLMAIINSANNKVLNIFITFVCLTETMAVAVSVVQIYAFCLLNWKFDSVKKVKKWIEIDPINIILELR